MATVARAAVNLAGMIPIIAVITGSSLIQLAITVVIAMLIFFVIKWGLGQFKIEEPFRTVIWAIVVLAVVVFCIDALLAVMGKGFIHWG